MSLPTVHPLTDIPLVADGEVAIIRPGDTFVLMTDTYELSRADADAVRSEVEARAPGVNVIVLAKGWRVGAIVREQEGEDDAAADD